MTHACSTCIYRHESLIDILNRIVGKKEAEGYCSNEKCLENGVPCNCRWARTWYCKGRFWKDIA